MKSKRPKLYIEPLPKASPSLPNWVVREEITREEERVTHITGPKPDPRSWAILGRARTTIVISTAIIKTPKTTTARTALFLSKRTLGSKPQNHISR